MMKRGRQSAADLSVVRLHPASPRRLEPPHDLTPAEAALFRATVAASAPGHLVETDVPLLVSYVQATLTSRRAAKAIAISADRETVNVWDRATRLQAALAVKLRLAPQSRLDAKVTGRRAAKHHVSAYDTMGDDDV